MMVVVTSALHFTTASRQLLRMPTIPNRKTLLENAEQSERKKCRWEKRKKTAGEEKTSDRKRNFGVRKKKPPLL